MDQLPDLMQILLACRPKRWVYSQCSVPAATIVCVLSHSVMSNSLRPHGMQPARLLCPWGFSRQEYWSGHVLLQGIFPTQGLNPGLPHCRWILYHLSHQERPRILKWVAYPFSRGSSGLGIKLRFPALQVQK